MTQLWRNRIITVILAALVCFANTGYTQTLSGFVFDKTNGEGLIGANVYIQKTGTGASTNVSGYFVIPSAPAGEYMISVSYIGYQTQTLKITIEENKDKKININLDPQAVETQEVVVRGDSVRTIDKLFVKPVSNIEMTQKQIEQVPRVVEADLLRALQTLPGITSISDFSSALYVRGGTPDQNLYLIDGTDVYNPEHAFGLFSTFNTNAIKKVDISKGGFGAEYGGRLSSVLDVTNLDGNRKEFEGVFNMSLLSASTTLQMPIGSIGSISGSLRRTYLDQTVAKWIDEVPDYYFIDGNVKAYFDLGNSDKVTLSYFQSYDDLDFVLDEEAQESFGFKYDWGNTTGSVNWKHIFGPKLFASVWFTASRFESDFDFADMNFNEHNYLSDYSLKAAFEWYASNELIVKFGAEQKLLHEVYDFDGQSGIVDIENNRQLSTGYVTGSWRPGDRWDINAGLRATFFNSSEDFTDLGPRLSIKYRLDEESNLKLAAGHYHQFINRIPRLFFSSIWSTVNKYNKVSSATHYIAGYQRAIDDVYQLEFETYFKRYKNIYTFNMNMGAVVEPQYFSSEGIPVYTTTQGLFNRGDGRSWGAEILLRKEVGEITGWASYSYSVTEHKFDGINGGEWFNPRHDRTHVFNLVANADLMSIFSGYDMHVTSKWILGVNFIYATGQALTAAGSAYYVNDIPDWRGNLFNGDNSPAFKLYPGPMNEVRLPDYMRLDLSLTYEKDFGSWKIAPYLQVYNIGNRGNVWFINYNDKLEDGTLIQEVETISMLPVLPSIGVTVTF